MRKLNYRCLTIAQQTDYFGLLVQQSEEGIILKITGLTQELALRQTRVFQAYVAIYAAKQLGLSRARQLLSDEGEFVSMDLLDIPRQEDSQVLLAIWFCQALLAKSDRQRVIAMYNAYGALAGGYETIVHTIGKKLSPLAAEALINTVNAERYDEGDLAEKAGLRPETEYQHIDFDAHLIALADSIV